jgi:hypothetical protein
MDHREDFSCNGLFTNSLTIQKSFFSIHGDLVFDILSFKEFVQAMSIA